MARNLTAFLVLVFAAACASAATCADGSSPGSNGCCAATNECPPCVWTVVGRDGPAGDPSTTTTCTCSDCAGETVTFDATCTQGSCMDMTPPRTGASMLGCEFCSGSHGTCMPNQAAAAACSSSMLMPVSISSSGLISARATLDCTACCPAAVCASMADAAKPECAACSACQINSTPCPKDSAAASLSSGALGTTLLAVTTTALLRGLLF